MIDVVAKSVTIDTRSHNSDEQCITGAADFLDSRIFPCAWPGAATHVIVRGGHVENLDKSLKQQVLQNYTGGSGGCQLGEEVGRFVPLT